MLGMIINFITLYKQIQLIIKLFIWLIENLVLKEINYYVYQIKIHVSCITVCGYKYICMYSGVIGNFQKKFKKKVLILVFIYISFFFDKI